MLISGRQRGYTLIELIVVLAIVAIMLMLAAPSLRAFNENGKIRSAAESLAAGLQTARSEAVRRNAAVEFLLTNDEPVQANANTTNLTATGVNWMVRAKKTKEEDPTESTYNVLAGKSFLEGSGRAGTNSVTVAGAVNGTAINSLTFNSLSSTNLNGPAIFSISNPGAGACSADIRCLNVRVAASGQTRICDPLVTTDNDSRRC